MFCSLTSEIVRQVQDSVRELLDARLNAHERALDDRLESFRSAASTPAVLESRSSADLIRVNSQRHPLPPVCLVLL